MLIATLASDGHPVALQPFPPAQVDYLALAAPADVVQRLPWQRRLARDLYERYPALRRKAPAKRLPPGWERPANELDLHWAKLSPSQDSVLVRIDDAPRMLLIGLPALDTRASIAVSNFPSAVRLQRRRTAAGRGQGRIAALA